MDREDFRRLAVNAATISVPSNTTNTCPPMRHRCPTSDRRKRARLSSGDRTNVRVNERSSITSSPSFSIQYTVRSPRAKKPFTSRPSRSSSLRSLRVSAMLNSNRAKFAIASALNTPRLSAVRRITAFLASSTGIRRSRTVRYRLSGPRVTWHPPYSVFRARVVPVYPSGDRARRRDRETGSLSRTARSTCRISFVSGTSFARLNSSRSDSVQYV